MEFELHCIVKYKRFEETIKLWRFIHALKFLLQILLNTFIISYIA